MGMLRGVLVVMVSTAVLGGLPAPSAAAAGETVTLTNRNLRQEIQRLRERDVRPSYIIPEPLFLDETTGAAEAWYVEDLTFSGTGCIYIGSKDLTLSVDGELAVSAPGQEIFASYPESERRAADGGPGATGSSGSNGSGDGASGRAGGAGRPGEPGGDGLPSGDLKLQLKRKPSQRFGVALVGQSGGSGGNGGNGGRGGDGSRGRTARSGVFGCERGGGDGGRGGHGGSGGAGGVAGRCGQGGELTVIAPREWISELAPLIQFDRTAARHGETGQPGRGGAAGSGGPMGRGNGFCGGGRAGSSGQPGSPGGRPAPPTETCRLPLLTFLDV